MENMEYILSLAGAALSILAALLTIAVKFVKAVNELKAREGEEEIGKKLPELIEEAEKFEEYSGAEKKAYVMDKIAEYAEEAGIEADLQYVSEKIEELVELSKQVNVNKSSNERGGREGNRMRREKGIERNGQGSGAGNNRRNGRREGRREEEGVKE